MSLCWFLVVVVGFLEDGRWGDLLYENLGVIGDAFFCEVGDGFYIRFDDGGFWFRVDQSILVIELWWRGCIAEASD